ncbi:MAG TPA: hypothetical protein VNT54_09325 [Solirubrobacteraceae bacterium]|nr:hypothetical protein [Solirubrobacteraceae bacterium]
MSKRADNPAVLAAVAATAFAVGHGAAAGSAESGKLSDLLAVTGGAWEEATAQLHVLGFFDSEAGAGRSLYRGAICTAR